VLKDDIGKDCGDHSACYDGRGKRKGKLSAEESVRALRSEMRQGLEGICERLEGLGLGGDAGAGGGHEIGGDGVQQRVGGQQRPPVQYTAAGNGGGAPGMDPRLAGAAAMGSDPMLQKRMAMGDPTLSNPNLAMPQMGIPGGTAGASYMQSRPMLDDPRLAAQMAAMHGGGYPQEMDSDFGPMDVGMVEPMMAHTPRGMRPPTGRHGFMGRGRPPRGMMDYGPPPMTMSMMPPRGGPRRPPHRPGGRRIRPDFPPGDMDIDMRRGGRGGGDFGESDEEWEDMGDGE
jgi:hypothetical protein